jgi:hypothetical protein
MSIDPEETEEKQLSAHWPRQIGRALFGNHLMKCNFAYINVWIVTFVKRNFRVAPQFFWSCVGFCEKIVHGRKFLVAR